MGASFTNGDLIGAVMGRRNSEVEELEAENEKLVTENTEYRKALIEAQKIIPPEAYYPKNEGTEVAKVAELINSVLNKKEFK